MEDTLIDDNNVDEIIIYTIGISLHLLDQNRVINFSLSKSSKLRPPSYFIILQTSFHNSFVIAGQISKLTVRNIDQDTDALH
jgi:hypothetical protein